MFYSNYQNFTPVLTNFSLGDGSCDCRYTQRYKSVHFSLTFILGTGFSIGTNPTIAGLPRFRHAQTPASFMGEARDENGDTYQIATIPNDATSFILGKSTIQGQHLDIEVLTATSPFTFVAGDKITIAGTYETV
jgi:hypothetical protein